MLELHILHQSEDRTSRGLLDFVYDRPMQEVVSSF